MLCSAEQSRDSDSACAMRSVSTFQDDLIGPVLSLGSLIAPCRVSMAVA